VHRRIRQLSEDLGGRLGRAEGLGIVVVFGGVAVDGGFEVGDRAQAALEPAPGQRREEGPDRGRYEP
jgi:hypothetical protein